MLKFHKSDYFVLQLLSWAKVQRLFCMGGALKRNPMLLEHLEVEYAGAGVECLAQADASVEACVGAALFTNAVATSKKPVG